MTCQIPKQAGAACLYFTSTGFLNDCALMTFRKPKYALNQAKAQKFFWIPFLKFTYFSFCSFCLSKLFLFSPNFTVFIVVPDGVSDGLEKQGRSSGAI